ncbi:ORF1 [Anelloviridae sp.]|nr:ORF1 [Anelloviridae sp.]
MPFWWRRRRKPWFGPWRRRRRFTRYKRRRFTTRRRNRRAPRRRRRRRRRKVRRKKKRIPILQWQPESIRKCKVKGHSCLVLGAEGKQFQCYTNEAKNYLQPKQPGGGGFGVEVYSLEYLYKQYKAHNCIFTSSNAYRDLVRYTGCQITLFRHPTIDFVVAYSIQPPFIINQFTYPDTHPQNLLLRKHHRVILSKASNPNGKLKVKLKIKPPKQMTTRWFFQREFADVPLVLIQAAACTFEFPRIGPTAASQISTIYFLNPEFWGMSTWAQQKLGPYMNIATGSKLKITYKTVAGREDTITVPPSMENTTAAYFQSINYSGGWFDKRVLNAIKIQKANGTEQEYAHKPISVARYNPNEDTGEGNEVWLASVLTGHFNKPTVSADYIIRGLPLWMSFYGYWNYLQYASKDPNIFKSHMFVVKCPAIKKLNSTITQEYYPIIDFDFINGKLPYEEYLSTTVANQWYPTAEHQMVTINSLVESGPYIPKLAYQKISTWELNYTYKFYFKWGGPQQTDPPVDDPKTQGIWDSPTALQTTIQIEDPKKQKPETMFHDWDYRRGFITQTALKRMSENIEPDSDVESYDAEHASKKRKVTKELPNYQEQEEETKACLLSLCKESTSQEETETLQEYIHKQHKQQRKLKQQLLHLFRELKHNQRFLQLQTGVLQ